LQPRVDDLRYTFAVHRITAWIENGADLNRMLPALAAYMGQVGLGSTGRYLFMTPERFRKNLDQLSPMHGKGRWRDDRELMQFLSNL
jgi:integrase/recombinase XerD